MTSTTTNEHDRLYNVVKISAKKFDTLTADADAKNSAVVDAMTALEKAVTAYNADTLNIAYAEFDVANSPLQALAIRATWDKLTTRRKDNVTAIVFRSARFDVLDYLQHVAAVRKDGKTITLPASVDTIKDALKKAAEALTAYILQAVNQDAEPVSIKNTAAAVYNYIKLYQLTDVRIRPNDVRYLCTAITRAGELGELKAVKPETVARYLLDVVHVQTKGKNYAFEPAKKAGKKEEEKKEGKR